LVGYIADLILTLSGVISILPPPKAEYYRELKSAIPRANVSELLVSALLISPTLDNRLTAMDFFAQELNLKLLTRYIAFSLSAWIVVSATGGCKSVSGLPGMSWAANQDTSQASLIAQNPETDQQKYPPPSASANPRPLTGPATQTAQNPGPNTTETTSLPATYPATNTPEFQATPTQTPPAYQRGPYTASPAPGSGPSAAPPHVIASNPIPSSDIPDPAAYNLNTTAPQFEPAAYPVHNASTQNASSQNTLAAATHTNQPTPMNDSVYSRDGEWIERSAATENLPPAQYADTTSPDTTSPDTTSPDTTSPDTTIHEVAIPETNHPQAENTEVASAPEAEPVPPADSGPAASTASLPAPVTTATTPWRPGSTSDFTIIR